MATMRRCKIPEDVMVIILYRLPAKSIARFRCVSKSWKSLFADPFFIKNHLQFSLNRSISNPSLILITNTKKWKLFRSSEITADHLENTAIPIPIPFPQPIHLRKNHRLEVVGSCYGLICLTSCYSRLRIKVYIWNPSLRKSITLPPFSIPIHENYGSPSFGFGYDATTNDYKVLKFVHGFDHKSNVEIYRFGKGCWEAISATRPSNTGCIYTSMRGVTVCGYVHWLACYENEEWRIIVFNFAEEVFSEMSVPNSASDSASDVNRFFLGELEGKLVLYRDIISMCTLEHRYQLWAMETDQCWMLKQEIRLNNGLCAFHEPIEFTSTDGFLMLDEKNQKIISYDAEAGQFKVLINGVPDCIVTPYVENLISLSQFC